MAIGTIGVPASEGDTLLTGQGKFTSLGLPSGNYSLTTPNGFDFDGDSYGAGEQAVIASTGLDDVDVFGGYSARLASNGYQQSSYSVQSISTKTNTWKDGNGSSQTSFNCYGYVNGQTWYRWWFRFYDLSTVSRSYTGSDQNTYTNGPNVQQFNTNRSIWRTNQSSNQFRTSSNLYAQDVWYSGTLSYTINCFGASVYADSTALIACNSGRIYRTTENASTTEVIQGNHPDVGDSTFQKVVVNPSRIALASSANNKLIKSTNTSYTTWSSHITNPINDVIGTAITYMGYMEGTGRWIIASSGYAAYSTDLVTWTEMAVPATGEQAQSGGYWTTSPSSNTGVFYGSLEGGPFAKYVPVSDASTFADDFGNVEYPSHLTGWYYQNKPKLAGFRNNFYKNNGGAQVYTAATVFMTPVNGFGVLKAFGNAIEVG